MFLCGLMKCLCHWCARVNNIWGRSCKLSKAGLGRAGPSNDYGTLLSLKTVMLDHTKEKKQEFCRRIL